MILVIKNLDHLKSVSWWITIISKSSLTWKFKIIYFCIPIPRWSKVCLEPKFDQKPSRTNRIAAFSRDIMVQSSLASCIHIRDIRTLRFWLSWLPLTPATITRNLNIVNSVGEHHETDCEVFKCSVFLSHRWSSSSSSYRHWFDTCCDVDVVKILSLVACHTCHSWIHSWIHCLTDHIININRCDGRWVMESNNQQN
jgi:hypothetical protein